MNNTAPTTAMTDAEINWLAREVLPSIRRTGSFAASQSPAPTHEVDPDAVARMIIAMTMEKLVPIERALNELAERIGAAVPVLVGTNTLIHSLTRMTRTPCVRVRASGSAGGLLWSGR